MKEIYISVDIETDGPIPGPNSMLSFGTAAVEAEVPEKADSFVIGLVMTGNGAAWFGDLEFTEINHWD